MTDTTSIDPARVVPPDDLRDYLRRYVALSDTQLDAITLWTVHTHCFEAFEATPYLAISSTEPRCGKTRLLEVLELVVDNPWLTGRVTGPALVRKIDAERPTLLLDETDATFTGARSSNEILRGVINSGYRLGGRTSYASGGTYRDLQTFCPKAFAGIGGLPSTIEDRSIPIRMVRRDFEHVTRFRHREAVTEARLVRARLVRFGMTSLDALAAARPVIPAALDDRAADVWEPLLAVADRFGVGWSARARLAAVSLMSERGTPSTASTLSLVLLRDVRAVFDLVDSDRISSADMVRFLLDGNDVWADVDGRPLDQRSLAQLLQAWQVAPEKIRFGRQTLQGYLRSRFSAAWELVDPEPVLVPAVPEVPEEAMGS